MRKMSREKQDIVKVLNDEKAIFEIAKTLNKDCRKLKNDIKNIRKN